MRIKKKDLTEALRKASKFTGRHLPITQMVLVSGEHQRIVATDLTTRFETPVEILDYTQSLTVPVAYPEEGFKADLEELKKDQLASLAEYAGVPSGKTKAAIVDAIVSASQAAADAEALQSDQEVTENFCVDPKHLEKIVASLELSGEDYVTLVPEMLFEVEGLFSTESSAVRLSVGDNFQHLAIAPAEDFPDWFDVQGALPVAKVAGHDLLFVAGVCVSDVNQQHFKECVLFDMDNDKLTTTDGNRLHTVDSAVDQHVMINAKALSGMAALAKDKVVEISYCPQVRFAVIKFNGDTASVRVDSDVQFPNYMDIMDGQAGQAVEIDTKRLNSLMKQAGLITGDEYSAVTLTFNGSLDAMVENPERGTYTRNSIDITGSVSPEVTLRLNPKFVMDAVRYADKTVQMNVKNGDSPMLITAGRFKSAIMPIRM